jgi:hypothetical protein
MSIALLFQFPLRSVSNFSPSTTTFSPSINLLTLVARS